MRISDWSSDVCSSDQILPRRTRLHLFGVKGDAIPYLTAFAHRVASIDSQAYGVSALNAARRCGQPKTDRMVADHMALWLCRQHARLDRPSRRLQMQPEMPPQPETAAPWERALAQARRALRDLIEHGDSKRVVAGTSGGRRGDLGGCRSRKKKKND